jgi:ketosteroid isomerase-like protein
MTQANVELSHQAYDAVNRRDLGALLELMDADVEAVPILAGMEGNYHGHDGIRRWWGTCSTSSRLRHRGRRSARPWRCHARNQAVGLPE